LVKLPPADTWSPSGGRGQGLHLGVEDGGERGVDRPVVASKAKMSLRAIAVVGAAALATLVNCPPATIFADLDDGRDLAVEHVRRPVGGVARDHHGLRHVDRGAGLRQQPDQDGGRQQRQQDTTTHLSDSPL
jgi:hypothetical protein